MSQLVVDVYTKKDVYKRLLYEVRFGDPRLREIQIWQDRPYTAVTLDAEGTILNSPFLNYYYNRSKDNDPAGIPICPIVRGWAKCNWPDKWDATYGYNLALSRACKKLANLLYYGHE